MDELSEREILEDQMIVETLNMRPIILDTLTVFNKYKGRFHEVAYGQVLEIINEFGRYIQTLHELGDLYYLNEEAIKLYRTLVSLLSEAIQYAKGYLRDRMELLRDLLIDVLRRYGVDYFQDDYLSKTDQEPQIPDHIKRAKEMAPMLEHLEISEEDLAESMRPIDPFEEADQILLDAVKRLYGIPEQFRHRGLKSKPEYLHKSETQNNLTKLGELILRLEKQLREKHEQT